MSEKAAEAGSSAEPPQIDMRALAADDPDRLVYDPDPVTGEQVIRFRRHHG